MEIFAFVWENAFLYFALKYDNSLMKAELDFTMMHQDLRASCENCSQEQMP